MPGHLQVSDGQNGKKNNRLNTDVINRTNDYAGSFVNEGHRAARNLNSESTDPEPFYEHLLSPSYCRHPTGGRRVVTSSTPRASYPRATFITLHFPDTVYLSDGFRTGKKITCAERKYGLALPTQ